MRGIQVGPVWLLLGVTLGLAGCKKSDEEAPAAVVTVVAQHPTEESISEEITADAVLAPLSQAAIAPRISAPIREEYVQRGAHVKRGQLLMVLEDRDLQGSAMDSRGVVQAAEASLNATSNAGIPEEVKKAEGDLEQAKASRDVAKRAAEERKRLYEQGALSGRDADTAFATYVQAEATYQVAQKHLDGMLKTVQNTDKQSAQGTLTSARGKLASAEAQVSYAALRSPMDGVVTDRPLFPGETAQAGATVITVMDTSSLLAKLHISQSAAQKLVLGHEAEVKVPGEEETVKAVVSLISPALDPGSTTVEVWLKLKNTDGKLRVGTPVHAVLTGDVIPHALQVPAAAIVPSQDGSTSVMTVGADGTAHRKSVKVGIRTQEAVQILSGLNSGDNVIVEGGYGLDNGTKVKIGKPGDDEDKDAADGDKLPSDATDGAKANDGADQKAATSAQKGKK